MDRTDQYINNNVGDFYIHGEKPARKRDILTEELRKLFPKRYEEIDKKKTAPTESERTAALYKSEGTKLSQNGTYVLEISVAGSGYWTFRSEHKDIGGKMSFRSRRDEREGLDELVEEKLGLRVGPKDAKYTFKKDTLINGRTMKTKFSIGGCGSDTGIGAVNGGYYKIEQNRQHILETAKRQLDPLFQSWKAGKKDVPQRMELMFRGHSRGAVATGQGAMLVNAWIMKEYPEFRDRVHFNIVQLDPVPGLGSNSGVNERIDYLHPTEEMIAAGMTEPLKPTDDTTVFISGTMEQEDIMHNLGFFNPQNVHGAKRVIVTRSKHSIYLDQFDDTQKDGRHFTAFTDEKGDAYRSYGISRLKPGVYVADQDHNLIHMENTEEIDKVFDKGIPLKGFVSKTNQYRKEVARNMAKEGMIRQLMVSKNAPKVLEDFQNVLSKTNRVAVRMTPRQRERLYYLLADNKAFWRMKQLQEKLEKSNVWYVRSSPQYHKLLTSMKAVQEATQPVNLVQYKRALTELKEATTAYLDYKKNNLNGNRAYERFSLASNLMDYTVQCQENLNRILEGARRPQNREPVVPSERVTEAPVKAQEQEPVMGM